jgi:cobalt/nickel transport system permease protein
VRESAVQDWARGTSPLHRRNSTCKLISLLIVLIAIATCPLQEWAAPAVIAALLIAGSPVAGIPAAGLMGRAAIVSLFVLPFAVFIGAAGDLHRAFGILVRAYSSATAIVVYAGITPVPETLIALRNIGLPPVLVEVIQFVYRFLFVIGEQARGMGVAATARGAARLSASAGSVAVLFARSYQRAEAVHQSMLSRGYRGDMPLLSRTTTDAADLGLVAVVLAGVIGFRLGGIALSK